MKVRRHNLSAVLDDEKNFRHDRRLLRRGLYGTVPGGKGFYGTASESHRSSEFVSLGMAPHLRPAGNRAVLQHPDTPGPVPPLRPSVVPGVLVAGRRAGWDLLLPGWARLLHRAGSL